MILDKVSAVSEETKDKIRRQSAFALPNNPSERGMTPDQIKKAFYAPILGNISTIAEINRVVEELNETFEKIDRLFSGDEVSVGEAKRTLEELIRVTHQDENLSLKEAIAAIDIESAAAKLAQEAAEAAQAGAESAQ